MNTAAIVPLSFRILSVRETWLKATVALAFACLTAVGAQVRIPLPFTPVPLTLQTLFVLSSGIFLGPGYGVVSMLAYGAMGAAGLPVFTGAASGIGIWSGVTAGYLAGFVFFAGISGYAFKRDRFRGLTPPLQCGLFYLGDVALILVPGTVVLKIVLGLDWSAAASLGFYPFLFGDLLKVIAAYSGTRFLERRFPVGDG